MAESAGQAVSDGATQSDTFDAQSFVTPELQAKFANVFGEDGDKARDAEVAPRQEGTKREDRPTPTRRPRRQSEEDEADDDELRDDESRDGRTADDTASGKGPATPGAQPPAGQQQAVEVSDEEQQKLLATLNPVLRHAARRGGWDDAEIAAALKVNPEAAERQFQKLHGSLNDLSTRFAMLGRQQQNMPQQMQGQQQGQQQQPQLDPNNLLESLFGKDFTTKFSDRYGETFVEDVLRPLHNVVIQPVLQMQQFMMAQQHEAMASELANALRPVLDELPEFYGKPTGQITEGQALARQNLVGLADQIRTGAMIQGQRLSIADALSMAHLTVASEHLAQIERKKLTQQVKNRSARFTSRPTQRQTAPRPGQPGAERSEKAAAEAYATRMAELGLD